MTFDHIVNFDSLESTNIMAKEMASKGSQLGTVVVARTQSGGRGRLNRVWHSPLGGLYFSILLEPKTGRRATDLPLLAGVAIAQGVKEILPKSVDVSLKWPNDVLVGWKKIAGVLCESTIKGPNLCVVGIGINVNTMPSELASFSKRPFGATSFSIESSNSSYDLVECLSVCLRKLETLYTVYLSEGFTSVQYLWEKNCRMIGKRVELREAGSETDIVSDSPSSVGTCLGIDEFGGIVLSNAKGERAVYYTGELTCFWP